jgi:hypothetical protein
MCGFSAIRFGLNNAILMDEKPAMQEVAFIYQYFQNNSCAGIGGE